MRHPGLLPSTGVQAMEDDEWPNDDEDILAQCEEELCETGLVTVSNPPLSRSKAKVPYDPDTVSTWVFPSNYPVRDYQKICSKRVITENLLVTLPTGTGKTLIAAVAIYNFLRWFPSGKTAFIAPTRPLVHQQLGACQDITGHLDAQQLTGITPQDARYSLWQEKRAFFCTAQVLRNDIQSGTCPVNKLVLLVVDEAHRATGNHAFAESVREVRKSAPDCRILALTATPGNDKAKIQHVIKNLQISAIENRTNESMDVSKYLNKVDMQSIVVDVSERMRQLQTMLGKICSPVLRKLHALGADIHQDVTKLTQYGVIKCRERWKAKKTGHRSMGQTLFTIAVKFAQAQKLLMTHGIRCFLTTLSSFEEEVNSKSKRDIVHASDFREMMKLARESISSGEIPSHPKIPKVIEILEKHFAQFPDTRAIVFSEFRDSVQEIVEELKLCAPLIRAATFVGQGFRSFKGLRQKEQLSVLEDFREGTCNALVSTCIGEEGLDIGEVDVIINFDVNKSPIRYIQRMGRTGRKRNGRVFNLLTRGKELYDMRASMDTKQRVQSVLRAKEFEFCRAPSLLPCVPEMIEKNFAEEVRSARSETPKSESRGSSNIGTPTAEGCRKLSGKRGSGRKRSGFMDMSTWGGYPSVPEECLIGSLKSGIILDGCKTIRHSWNTVHFVELCQAIGFFPTENTQMATGHSASSPTDLRSPISGVYRVPNSLDPPSGSDIVPRRRGVDVVPDETTGSGGPTPSEFMIPSLPESSSGPCQLPGNTAEAAGIMARKPGAEDCASRPPLIPASQQQDHSPLAQDSERAVLDISLCRGDVEASPFPPPRRKLKRVRIESSDSDRIAARPPTKERSPIRRGASTYWGAESSAIDKSAKRARRFFLESQAASATQGRYPTDESDDPFDETSGDMAGFINDASTHSGTQRSCKPNFERLSIGPKWRKTMDDAAARIMALGDLGDDPIVEQTQLSSGGSGKSCAFVAGVDAADDGEGISWKRFREAFQHEWLN